MKRLAKHEVTTTEIFFLLAFISKALQPQRRRQREHKKNHFMNKTIALHIHYAFKYISLKSTARLGRETP